MQFDLMIIGGGMVGATLAATLQNSHLRIAIVDAAPLNIAEDERLIALNDSSCCLFSNMGIWPALKPFATPIEQIHVSHHGRFGMTRIHADVVGLASLGYVVPAKHINAALFATLQDAKNIEFLRPATLQTLSQQEDGVTLTLKSTAGIQEYTANKVIGADGSFSTVRQLLNIDTKTLDYHQTALVTVVELQRDHQNIAYERFQDSGAIAMLPLAKQRVATIWTDDNKRIVELMQLNALEFLSVLQQQFGYRLGRLRAVGKRHIYPLQMLYSAAPMQQKVLLIGNAAHTLHPIAAQGLNLALYEIAVLAEHFLQENALALPFPKNSSACFTQQNFSRRLSHRLAWLFSTDSFLLNMGRQVGMIGLDLSTLAKKSFVNYALGRQGRVPPLLIRKSG